MQKKILIIVIVVVSIIGLIIYFTIPNPIRCYFAEKREASLLKNFNEKWSALNASCFNDQDCVLKVGYGLGSCQRYGCFNKNQDFSWIDPISDLLSESYSEVWKACGVQIVASCVAPPRGCECSNFVCEEIW
jgi:hypothetical protein